MIRGAVVVISMTTPNKQALASLVKRFVLRLRGGEPVGAIQPKLLLEGSVKRASTHDNGR